MIIFKTANSLSLFLSHQKAAGKKAGFVPTMGALHAGHLSLIQRAKAENDLCICSIFVNPTQFNNAADFTHYPVTIEKDIEQLELTGCDILFLPSKTEIYPEDYTPKHYALGTLEEVLEGAFRPGHFQGVCQVVDRLLEIIEADKLYLGQKDYQQCMVIDKLLELTGRREKVNLTIAPTMREASGLAMSSRNMRLSEEEKEQATIISKTLFYIKQNCQHKDLSALKERAEENLSKRVSSIDYLAIVDAVTLQPVTSLKGKVVALIACFVGPVRLIDNEVLN